MKFSFIFFNVVITGQLGIKKVFALNASSVALILSGVPARLAFKIFARSQCCIIGSIYIQNIFK